MYLEALREVLPRVGSVVVVQEGQMSPLPLLNLRDAQPPLRQPAQQGAGQ
jgi:membrane protease subunit HflK